jgi:hypothetical protein
MEQGVDLVLRGILMHVLVMRNSFVLERFPVKFSTRIEHDIFDHLISVLTTGLVAVTLPPRWDK